MHNLKFIFSALTIIFCAISLAQLVPYNISMPIMFIFMGLALLVNAKEFYDKGAKQDAIILLV